MGIKRVKIKDFKCFHGFLKWNSDSFINDPSIDAVPSLSVKS